MPMDHLSVEPPLGRLWVVVRCTGLGLEVHHEQFESHSFSGFKRHQHQIADKGPTASFSRKGEPIESVNSHFHNGDAGEKGQIYGVLAGALIDPLKAIA